MKRLFLSLLLVATLAGGTSCSSGGDDPAPATTNTSAGDPKCGGLYNGQQLYKGPKGGCYYINSSGNKEYVDRKYCNC